MRERNDTASGFGNMMRQRNGGPMREILLIQGPNMSYLGRRQPEIYGRTTAAQLDAMLRAHARAGRYGLEIFYTHSEAAAIERLYRAAEEKCDGVVMNPAAFLFA